VSKDVKNTAESIRRLPLRVVVAQPKGYHVTVLSPSLPSMIPPEASRTNRARMPRSRAVLKNSWSGPTPLRTEPTMKRSEPPE
jgi:hypothetical protein